jgi:hypothetical protein
MVYKPFILGKGLEIGTNRESMPLIYGKIKSLWGGYSSHNVKVCLQYIQIFSIRGAPMNSGISMWSKHNDVIKICKHGLMIILSGFTCHAGLPEPGMTLYGVVREGKTGHKLRMGSLSVEIENEATGEKLTVQASLNDLQDGYSFFLDVPFEREVQGDPVSEKALALPITSASYQWTFSINGVPAYIQTSQGGEVQLSSASRGTVERLDLQVDLSNIDTDEDGLPDWYELHYGFDPDSEENHATLNENGMNNLKAYISGLDPNDPASVFRMEGLQVDELGENTGMKLTWLSAVNRLYTIYRGQSLTDQDFEAIESDLPATPPINTYTDPNPPEGPVFDFIEVELAP